VSFSARKLGLGAREQKTWLLVATNTETKEGVQREEDEGKGTPGVDTISSDG
jgi:hypothetical protein